MSRRQTSQVIEQISESPRLWKDDRGTLYVGVTSAIGLVSQVLGEPPESYGPEAMAKIHALEGTACHKTCLDWLAHSVGWIPEYEPLPWPKAHGDERRWRNVMSMALQGFQEFCKVHEVVPIAIEAEGASRAYGLVGHLDLYCEMTMQIGRKPRRVKAVDDLKFVRAVRRSHKIQVRCYSKLDEFKDAQVGVIFHGNRETGTWRTVPVDLSEGMDEMIAVSHAAFLYMFGHSAREVWKRGIL